MGDSLHLLMLRLGILQYLPLCRSNITTIDPQLQVDVCRSFLVLAPTGWETLAAISTSLLCTLAPDLD